MHEGLGCPTEPDLEGKKREGEDRDDFISWMIRPVFKRNEACDSVGDAVSQLRPSVEGYYAAAFAELRSDLVAAAELRKAAEPGEEYNAGEGE